jgi:predicted nuclease with TOPRIM domain
LRTIKDLADLTTQLANTVEDRKIASELNSIQTPILKLQSEQATLHETNIELREERLALEERIHEWETTIHKLQSKPSSIMSDVPTCPNFSTTSKPFFMSPVPEDFINILNATHECPKCEYKTKIDS